MLIKSHGQLTDDELEEQFESFRLKPGMFSHEAHLRLVYIHLKKYGIAKAEINMCQQIRGYAQSLNVFDKFNKTVTIASTRIMNRYMEESQSNSFDEFLEEFPSLLSDFKGILKRHYSFNVFGDKEAKKEFQEPDLLPL